MIRTLASTRLFAQAASTANNAEEEVQILCYDMNVSLEECVKNDDVE